MSENEKLYHSALSRCAELLSNMPDGDPITDVPMYLAAKLEQMRRAGAAKGGNTSEEYKLPPLPLDLDNSPARMSLHVKAGELAEIIRRWGSEVVLASQSKAAQPSDSGLCEAALNLRALAKSGRELRNTGEYYKLCLHDVVELERVAQLLDNAAAHLAGQSQATRAVPDKLENLTRYMFTFEGMEVDNACGRYYLADDVDSFVEKRLAPTAQEVTQQAAPDDERYPVDPNVFFDALSDYDDSPMSVSDGQRFFDKLNEVVTQQAAKAETAEQAPSAKVIISDGNGTATIMLAPGADLKVGTSLYIATTTSTVSATPAATLLESHLDYTSSFLYGTVSAPEGSGKAPATTAEGPEPRPVLYARQVDLNRLPEDCGVATSRRSVGEWRIPLYANRAPAARVAILSAPDDWKLVPVEPTEDMLVAFAETWFSKARPLDDCGMEDCYAAMLAAVPELDRALATSASALRTTSGKGEAA